MYCEEKDRSWCSSSSTNDNRAITIECASDTTAPYAMNSKVYAALIDLCVDICKRYGKTKLLWLGDKAKTLAYMPKADEMLITVHRWYANKSCPGDWLYNRLGELATAVTQRLGGTGGSNTPPATKPSTGTGNALYRVRKSWVDSKSQKGAFKSLDNAKATADKNPGYSVFDSNGKAVYTPGGTTTPSFKPYLVKVTTDVLYIRKGAGTNYGTSGAIRDKRYIHHCRESEGRGCYPVG